MNALSLAVAQAARRVLPWHERWALVIILVACVVAVVATAMYPWKWRLLGLALLAFIAGWGLFAARAVAGFSPWTARTFPSWRWEETYWLTKALVVGGAVGITAGYGQRIWADWRRPEVGLSWRLVARRLALLLIICADVRVGLRLAHSGLSWEAAPSDWVALALAVVGLAVVGWLSRGRRGRRGIED